MDSKPRRPVKRTPSCSSWCGSGTSDGHISLRTRRRRGGARLTERPIDVLARILKDKHQTSRSSSLASSRQDNASCCSDVERASSGRTHFNVCFHQLRYLVAFFGGLAIGLMTFHRLSMAIIILPMVNQTHLYLAEHPNASQADLDAEGFQADGEFNWNNETVAIILGWYMFSYTLPQIPITRLNSLIGCRLAIPLGLLIVSLSSWLTPKAAYLGWRWVVACRLLNGVGAAGTVTGVIQLFEDWLRYDELSLGLTISSFVTTSMVAACPFIAGELAALHWSLAFTIPSYFTIGFCLLWLVLVTSEPESNWLISKQELDHLAKSDDAGDGGLDREPARQQSPTGVANVEEVESEQISWLAVFKLVPFYAYNLIWVINCSYNNNFMFVLPTYLRQFLKVSIAQNGLYCLMIQSGLLLAIVWPQLVLKRMQRRGLSVTRCRLISQTLSCLVMSATFIYVALFHELQPLLLFIGRCFMVSDVIVMGSVMSNFAKAGISGITFAVINTLGNLSITLVSPLIGWWLDYSGSSTWGWSVIFYGFAAAQLAIFLVFAMFIDSEPIELKGAAKKEPKSAAEEAA